jgi:hypothetical protein
VIKTSPINLPAYGDCTQLLHQGRYYLYSPQNKTLYNYNPYSGFVLLRQAGILSLNDAERIVLALTGNA